MNWFHVQGRFTFTVSELLKIMRSYWYLFSLFFKTVQVFHHSCIFSCAALFCQTVLLLAPLSRVFVCVCVCTVHVFFQCYTFFLVVVTIICIILILERDQWGQTLSGLVVNHIFRFCIAIAMSTLSKFSYCNSNRTVCRLKDRAHSPNTRETRVTEWERVKNGEKERERDEIILKR